MRLSDFEWSRNPRGLHVQRILITPLDVERWTRPHFGWVKLIASQDEYIDVSRTFIERNVTPVLRPYRGRWGARPMDQNMQAQILAYARAGVKWFEFYNEPNLDIEWELGVLPDWRDTQNQIRPLMENWLTWAEFIISIGGYPGFIPLAESDVTPAASVLWMDAMLNYMAEHRYERFRNVLASGAYCATHPYIFNHFYQERPNGGPASARSHNEQNADEGGWHFEYPYDPISQRDDPGRTIYGGTALTPNGDPVGLLAMGQMFNERCAKLFGTQAIPVLGTEGGIWPFRGDDLFQLDNRYPAYTEKSQGEATLAMFEWITHNAPDWFFGVCLWKEDEYYYNGAHAPAISRLMSRPPLLRTVPNTPVMGDGSSARPLNEHGDAIGPAPIQGRADFHIILLAPGVTEEWLFETAQNYWESFRPIITDRIDIIGLVPNTHSLAVTVISSPDMVELMEQQVKEKYPNVWFDLIVTTEIGNVQALFNSRVMVNRRFG